MIKLRIATGVGLLLLMAAMACGPVRMSEPPASDGGVTLASLAGKFETRGSGVYTLCFRENFTEEVDCASAPHEEVPFKLTAVSHNIRDAVGNSCAFTTMTGAPTDVLAYSAKYASWNLAKISFTRTNVSTITSFDPTTGSGTESLNRYAGGRCNGAVFDSTGAFLTGTGTQSFMVSNSGNRIETILTSFSMVTSPFSVAGSMKETMPVNKATSIRQSE
jgi:hypothetical protein